jgi:hypothetical protein
MTVLEVKRDLRYREKIENYEEFTDSFHSDVYKRAWQIFKEIYDNSLYVDSKRTDPKKNNVLNNEETKNKKENNKKNSLEQDNENRIIAFVGERGSGKSSAMNSFAEALTNNDYLKKQGLNIDEIFFEKVPIDPSFFEENENIIELIIAKLFENFKQILNKDDLKDNYHGKRDLLTLFEEVYKNIKTIEKHEKFIENDEIVEQISNLASSSKLKNNLLELFSKYLNFCYPEETGKKFLLFVIDDFDLNIKHGNEMAEHIRKYLLHIPNVIVLVSLNMEDLKELIDRGNAGILEVLLKHAFLTYEDVAPKSFKYLEKFIPYPRRIFMPEIQRYKNIINLKLDEEIEKEIAKIGLNDLLIKEFLFTLLTIKEESAVKDHKILKDFSESIIGEIENLKNFKEICELKIDIFLNENRNFKLKDKERFLESIDSLSNIKLEEKLLILIYLKTGLLLFKNEGRNITLVPSTLREFRNFILFLIDLENENYSKNTNEFEKYLLENWIEKNV